MPKDVIIEKVPQEISLRNLLLLFTTILFSQNSIVTAGNENYTIGETFPIMQQIDTVIDVSLSVPKYEIPAEQPKLKPAKKKSFIEKLLEFIKQLFN